jgi:RES domain-containing protein
VPAALDEEQAAAAAAHNQPALEWSAREAAVRDVVASTIDRIVDLERVYESVISGDSPAGALLVKISTELRLQETSLAGLLKQVSPDLPAEPSRTSQKARRAVKTRWDRQRARNV